MKQLGRQRYNQESKKTPRHRAEERLVFDIVGAFATHLHAPICRLCYKGSPFHRVVRDAWVQGGDILSGAGDGGCSVYGETFGDESFAVKLNESGVLAMANDGPHTNSSQFLVTLAPQPWLNHKVVGFGR